MACFYAFIMASGLSPNKMSSVEFQSKDHRDLLDSIDKLRSRGISRYVDLPEIVVCGDQSAGKSSVLEAISGMSFPTKDNLCTRFATELILRRHATSSIKVSINPGPDRSSEEKERLSEFSAALDSDLPDIGSVVEKAKLAMGLSDCNKVFSSDTLRIELGGPSQPHLTLVDLPGLFRAGNREQSVQDAEIVRKMVRQYAARPRSIILAVVSAKSDFALQEVTEMARELDPKGIRTLGLITKPDALDAGSDSEAYYIKLVQNRDVVFSLGWHVLKNRGYKMRDATSAERDEDEARFFSEGAWTTINPSHLGVKTLKFRLSNVLKDQILQQMPELLQDVDAEIAASQMRLQRLGLSRSTHTEQRKYLLQVSRDFTFLIKAAVDGEYSNPFFGAARTDEGYRKRLRARIQNTLAGFEQTMREHGRSRVIVDRKRAKENDVLPRQILRAEYIDEVKDLMSRSRARELPGTFNPSIIGELFTEQCQPWKKLAANVEQDILQIVYDMAWNIVEHVSAQETSEAVFHMIGKAIDKLKYSLEAKFRELLLPHLEAHPITYNHYLTETVQKSQAQRRRARLKEELRAAFKVTSLSDEIRATPLQILYYLEAETQPDMERFGSELAVDYMEAYYEVCQKPLVHAREILILFPLQVALKKFVDDVSVLAVEQCLVSKLPTLFQSDIVFDLEDREIARLAADSDDAKLERSRLSEKLSVLEEGKTRLLRLDAHRPPVLGEERYNIDLSCAV